MVHGIEPSLSFVVVLFRGDRLKLQPIFFVLNNCVLWEHSVVHIFACLLEELKDRVCYNMPITMYHELWLIVRKYPKKGVRTIRRKLFNCSLLVIKCFRITI